MVTGNCEGAAKGDGVDQVKGDDSDERGGCSAKRYVEGGAFADRAGGGWEPRRRPAAPMVRRSGGDSYHAGSQLL